MDKGCPDGTDAKAERGCGNEPTGAEVLASSRRRDFEDDVADVEHRQDDIVVVSLEAKVLLQARQFSIACVRVPVSIWWTLPSGVRQRDTS